MRAVVTGGSGFLGGRIVALLRARGDDVRVVARRRDLTAESLGAECVTLDIRDAAALRVACERADVVFHIAGMTGHWGSRREFWSVNVDGTRSVLAAVRATGVRVLVYTSTPSVVGYARDVENGGPDLPYGDTSQSAYAESKAAAERLVLAASDAELATVALRPHLVIGPGDRAMLPRVVRRAARGRLRVIGGGENRVDLTYVDNAAWAHLDAADALMSSGARPAGKPYFISNDEPVLLWPWLNRVLHDLGIPAVEQTLPLGATLVLAGVLEQAWRTLRLDGEPPITRFLATALARSHWFDMEPARRDLGYRVRVPLEEGTQRTIQWLAGAGVAARTSRGAFTTKKINTLMMAAKKHQTEPSASGK